MSISLQNLQGNYSNTQIQGTWNATTRPTEGAMNMGNTIDLNSLFQNLLQSLLAIIQGLQGDDDGQTKPNDKPNDKPSGQQADIPEVSSAEFNRNAPALNLNAQELGTSEFTVDNNRLDRADGASLRGNHVISNQQQLEDFADAIGVSVDDLPTVDFDNQLLSYSTRDVNDPNSSFGTSASLDNDGTAQVISASTLIGFKPSNESVLDFVSLDREGVEEFASSNPYNEEPLV